MKYSQMLEEKRKGKGKKDWRIFFSANLALGFFLGDEGEDQDHDGTDDEQGDDDAQHAAAVLLGGARGIACGAAHIAHGGVARICRAVDDAVAAFGGAGCVAQIALAGSGVEHAVGAAIAGTAIIACAAVAHIAGIAHIALAILASVYIRAVSVGCAHGIGGAGVIGRALVVSGGEEVLHGLRIASAAHIGGSHGESQKRHGQNGRCRQFQCTMFHNKPPFGEVVDLCEVSMRRPGGDYAHRLQFCFGCGTMGHGIKLLQNLRRLKLQVHYVKYTYYIIFLNYCQTEFL